jgi:glycosyltransferase involved in cell wall biosynthesis
MKKIVFIVLHLDYGGIEQATIHEANILSEYYDVTIVSTYKISDKPAFQLSDRIKIEYLLNIIPNRKEFIYSLKKLNLVNIIKECHKSIKVLYMKRASIIKYLGTITCDIIISTRYYYNKIISKYYYGNSILIAREHVHHNNNKKYIKKICNSVDEFNYFLPVSKELTEFYAQKLLYKKVKVMYVPNFIDNVPLYEKKDGGYNLIAVGRFSKEKGFVKMIDIINELKKIYSDVKLHLIGDGTELENIKNKISILNCSNCVLLHGYKNREYINELYKNSSIYIMTSFEESFGLVLIEAQSYGLPCIAYDSAQGAREIIEDGVSGYLIKNRNLMDFVDKIKILFNNKDMYQSMSKRAYNNANLYTKKNLEKIWVNIIDNIDSI